MLDLTGPSVREADPSGNIGVKEEKRIPLLLTLGGHTWELRSDDDGYFTLRGETPSKAVPGWQPLRVEVAGGAIRTDYPLLIVPDGEVLGIISDVDDTVVVSDVADRSRLLAHTFLKNYLQRRAIPGVADFYRSLMARNSLPDATPVIYLTATPRHLLSSLNAFLEHNGFPPGAILAKKVTDGAEGDPLLDQERYKLARIEAILADLPGVRFVLSGDDGERDPEVFHAIRERHPLRIDAVVGPGAVEILVRAPERRGSLVVTMGGGPGFVRIAGRPPQQLRPTGALVELPLSAYHEVRGTDRSAVFSRAFLWLEQEAVLRPGQMEPGGDELR